MTFRWLSVPPKKKLNCTEHLYIGCWVFVCVKCRKLWVWCRGNALSTAKTLNFLFLPEFEKVNQHETLHLVKLQIAPDELEIPAAASELKFHDL